MARRLLLIVVAALLATGCEATNPSPLPSVIGTWTGTMATSLGPTTARFDFTQQSTTGTVVGAWAITSPNNTGRGQTAGEVRADTVTVNIGWNANGTLADVPCVGNAMATGTLRGTSLTLTSPGFTFLNCTNPPLNITWSLTRQ